MKSKINFRLVLICLMVSQSMHIFGQVKDLNQLSVNHVFIENKGQFQLPNGQKNDSILYMLKAQNVDIAIGYNCIHYYFKSRSNQVETEVSLNNRQFGILAGNTDLNPITPSIAENKLDVYRLDMFLSGSKYPSKIKSENVVDYYENYYNLINKPNGVTQVHGCEKIVMENVYSGIDWVIYIKNNELKYDFIVHPNADKNKIQLEFKGQSQLNIDSEGNLIAETIAGKIKENAPQSFQYGKLIRTQFEVNNNLVRFNYLDEIDQTKDLVVDPCLSWGTYFAYSDDYSTRNFKDKLKNIYLVGYTSSSNNIATSGAYQTTIKGSYDGYIVKFDKNGNRLWSTYYGGTSQDQIFSGTCDLSNNVIVVGSTYSSANIATSGGFQVSVSSSGDGFVAKFNSSGVLQWGTYVGGTNYEILNDVVVDGSSNIYAVGNTSSASMATTGAAQTSLGGSSDGYILKLSSSGARLWSTYSGGTGSDYLNIAGIDNASNLIVGGTTTSSASMATAGTQQTVLGGSNDGFVLKYSSAGAKTWGTYIGGSAYDEVNSLVIDGANSIWICGRTQSTSGIASTGSHQATSAGADDGFVVKLNASGIRQFGTYYGGAGSDNCKSIKLDVLGSVYVVGQTTSSSSIATSGSHQSTYLSSNDVFLTKFNGSGVRQWATYYGGTGNDYNPTVETDSNDVVYISGSTTSSSNIATKGSFLSTLSGNNAFLVKFDPSGIYKTTQSNTVCKYTSVTFTALKTTASSYTWNTGQTTSSISTAAPKTYYVKYTNSVNCTYVDTFKLLNYNVSGQSTIGLYGLFCQSGMNVSLGLTSNQSIANYTWYNSLGSYLSSSNYVSVNQEDVYKCVVTVNPNACKDTITYKLVLAPLEVNIPKTVTMSCIESYYMPTQSNYNSGISYSWSPPDGINGYQYIKQPLFSPKQSTQYVLTSGYNGQCIQKDTVNFVISGAPTPLITYSENKTQCYGSNYYQFSAGVASRTFPYLRQKSINPVSVYPALPDLDDTVTVYFNAKAGNGKLIGSSAVYMYTGLITNKSSNGFNWKHVVGNTTGALSYCKMKSLGNDLWSITLPIKSFYSKNEPFSADEFGVQMAFVFHNAVGNVFGKGTFNEDIFYPMYDPNNYYTTNNQLKLVVPNMNESQEIVTEIMDIVPLTFTAGVKMDQLILYIDGVKVKQVNNSDTLTYYFTSTYARSISVRIYAYNSVSGYSWQRYYSLYVLNLNPSLSYKWDFGDSKYAYSAGPNFKTYATAGNYTVKLDVSDGACKYNQATTNVVVLPKISPKIKLPATPYCLKQEFIPDASSTSILGGETGVNYSVNYQWQFGDGTQSSSIKPTKLYSKPGVYKVVLKTSGSQLCEDSSITYIQVYDQPDLKVTCNNPKFYSCLNGTQITASSGYNIYSWSTGESGQVISRTAPGKTVLTAFTNAGCSATQSIELFAHPELKITTNNNFTICDQAIPITISVEKGYSGYYWNTGDQGTEIQVNSPGTYTVGAYDGNCLFESSTNIQDGTTINANFTFDILSANSLRFRPFSNQAKYAAWNFGDGNVSIELNPVHEFTGNGKYVVCLNLMNSCQVRSNYCRSVTLPFIVGSENIENGNIAVYPNPGNGKYHLVSLQRNGFVKYQITDSKGQLIQKSDKFDLQEDLILNASSGIYFLTIEKDGIKSTQIIDHINN